jgi:Protein of unknown function (DUF4058)
MRSGWAQREEIEPMSRPFLGMDPFVESLGIWRDFQLGLIASCRSLLNSSLPRNYVALADEEIELLDLTGEATVSYRPDVMATEGAPRITKPSARGATGGVATLEPVIVPVALKDFDEVHNRWID